MDLFTINSAAEAVASRIVPNLLITVVLPADALQIPGCGDVN
jgi:hypothetical protein